MALLVLPRSWSVRRVLAGSALLAWAILCVAFGTYMLASHLLTLPAPQAADPVLHQTIATRRHVGQHDRWLALHVVLAGCKCSQGVLDHLMAGHRPTDLVERVVLIAEDRSEVTALAAAISAHGFDLDIVTPDQLVGDYHIEAAPLLVIADPRDTVRYVGGYTLRKQSADVRDLAILAAVEHGETVKPLPTFGCAVGRALRSTLDPLGVR